MCAECRHHHRLKHEAGWQVHNDPDDPATLTWTTPTGHAYTTRARPPLVPV
jgi:magnesium-transporting ATPase (P-type)